ncbi:myomesin and myosin binding protein [Carabus blaptoides fortunei]
MGNSQTKGQAKNRQKKQVHWKAAERPAPPGKPQLVPGAEITPDVVTIKWDKPKSDGGAPITGYLVEHRRTGSPHWVRATPLLVNVPELTLSGLEPGWRYQFRVTAQNPVGMSDPGEISEPLTVTLQRSVITAPKFTEELKETTALENEMAEFEVHVLGQPPPKVCWFKDGFEIFSSRRTRIITENDKSVLTIHQVSLMDEGEIKCTATNKAGHASTKAVVKVEAPPVIRLPRQYEDGLLFELDEIIRLKVSIAGRPQPLVFWAHNGETIQNDDRYEIINTDRASVLRVGEAKRSDRGEYQIRAVNQLGEDHTSFLVTVTDKPKPPCHLKVIMSLGKTVTLSWEVPADDGGCKIGNYIVEYYRIGWNVWLKASTCRQLTTTLSDLIEGSEYKFRVKAESPYGVSDPSDETDVIFIPDPKRGMLSPPPRSRSQPRDAVRETIPVPPKRRSASSTRNAEREAMNSLTPQTAAPIPPKREKIKTPHRSPENSPEFQRRDLTGSGINKTIFDRSSLAREITYGTDIKYKRPEMRPQPVLQKEEEIMNDANKKSPIPIKRERSPSRINQFLSNILPKKSPSPSPPSNNSPKNSPSPNKHNLTSNNSPSPNKHNLSPNNSPSSNKHNLSPNNTPSPVVERKEVISSMKGDHLDRLGPIIINRRSSSPMILDRSRSPSPMDMTRNRSPSLAEHMIEKSIHLSPTIRSKSPSPNPASNDGSPTSRRNSINNDTALRRSSIQSYQNNNNNDMVHGSSEFMLVILEDHDAATQNYLAFDNNLIAPPMSLSAPELGADSELFSPLKNSVSSTELLHERAFARFAKEAEEWNRGITPDRISLGRRASLEKNRKFDIKEVDDRRPSIPKILINSKENEDIAGLDRIPSFVRRLSAGVTNMAQQYAWANKLLGNSGDSADLHDINIRAKMANNEHINRKNSLEDKTGKQDSLSKVRNDSVEEEESYSEEESESEEDERSKHDLSPPHIETQEQETYHPQRMVPSTVSKHDEPFEILTKPSPLPDPNFIPKPILKKPDLPVTKKSVPEKPVRKSLTNEPNRDLLSPNSEPIISRTPSPSRRGDVNQRQPSPMRNTPEAQMISAAQAAKNKRMLNRQNSEEEAKVVADHYSDIVRTYSQPKKFHPPLVNRDELRSASEPDDYLTSEESLHMLHKRESSPVRTITPLPVKQEPVRTIAKRVPSPCPVRRPMVPDTATNKPKTRTRSRSSSRTRNETRRAVTPSAIQNRLNMISRTPSPRSMTPSSRPFTPEQEALQAEVEIKVRTTMEYMTDVAMFIVACWLYLFKDARLAIPILIIMVYRQLKDEVKNRLPAWMTKSRKP